MIPTQLRERHDELVTELRGHLDDLTEGRSTDDVEASAKYERINTELSSVEVRMQEFRRLAKAEDEQREARQLADDLANRSGGDADKGDKGDKRTHAEIEAAQFRSLIDGDSKAIELKRPTRRDLTAGTAADGAELISTGFTSNLYDIMLDHAAIRQTRATVISTSTGNALEFPKVTSHSAAALVAEGGAIGESDPQFGTMTLDAYKYAFLVQVSTELEQDEEIGLQTFLAAQAGRALGDATGTAAILGTGSAQPQGITGVATTGVTAASATVFTANELIDLQHSVIPAYRRNAEWVLNDTSMAELRKLATPTDGGYLWRPGFAEGEPSTILGKPYVIDPNVEDSVTGDRPVFFGDFSTFYLRDVNSVRVERSTDFAFSTDLVTYRFIVRFDSDLIDVTGAIKCLVML